MVAKAVLVDVNTLLQQAVLSGLWLPYGVYQTLKFIVLLTRLTLHLSLAPYFLPLSFSLAVSMSVIPAPFLSVPLRLFSVLRNRTYSKSLAHSYLPLSSQPVQACVQFTMFQACTSGSVGSISIKHQSDPHTHTYALVKGDLALFWFSDSPQDL